MLTRHTSNDRSEVRPLVRPAAAPAAVLVAILVMAICSSALAQSTRGRSRPGPRPGAEPAVKDDGPRPDYRRLGLEQRPLAVESLGLEFHPPAGSTFTVQRLENRVSVVLMDGADVPAWQLQVQSDTPTMRGMTPRRQIQEMLNLWRGIEHPPVVLSNDPVVFGGRTGQLCYIRQEVSAGDEIISGWLKLQLESGDLLTFAVQTLPSEFSAVRAQMEAMFSTIRIVPLSQIAQKRKERLDAGLAFISSLTEARLRTLIDRERWYRYFIPAATTGTTADKELGYYLVEYSEGKLGAIDPDKSELNYDPSEQTLGLLVHVHGHSVDMETNTTYDSEAYYWMAWDQAEEAWSVRGTRRFQGKEVSEAMTGIRTPRRTGNPTGTITVINSGLHAANREEKSWRVPDVYLSQPLRWAMGYLLPRDERVPMQISSYCFDNSAARLALSLRIDDWIPASDGSDDWVLKSRARSEAPETISRFDDTGELSTRQWADGAVTERITLPDLHRLWKSKGLPTGGFRRR